MKKQNRVNATHGPIVIELESPTSWVGRDCYIIKIDDSQHTITVRYDRTTIAVLREKNETLHVIALAKAWVVL